MFWAPNPKAKPKSPAPVRSGTISMPSSERIIKPAIIYKITATALAITDPRVAILLLNSTSFSPILFSPNSRSLGTIRLKNIWAAITAPTMIKIFIPEAENLWMMEPKSIFRFMLCQISYGV